MKLGWRAATPRVSGEGLDLRGGGKITLNLGIKVEGDCHHYHFHSELRQEYQTWCRVS